ncbi:MAG: energy transducer TonB [Chitinophagaceae bacterium]
MRLSKLNLALTGILAFVCLLFLVVACNNDDKSGNNSTTETITDSSNNSTVIPSTKTDSTKATAKKIGKISIKEVNVDKTVAMKTDDKGYYNYAETAPAFPGGQSALENYIMNNVEYPQEAIDNNAEGTVYVMFTVDENGRVANAKTTGTALGYGLEEEAIRVVNGMSKWTPGMNKGKKTKVWYTIPITYRLEA